MKVWDLILDEEALLEYILPCEIPPWEEKKSDEINDFKKTIRNHRIVYSENLIDLLTRNRDFQFKLFLQSQISSINCASRMLKIEDADTCDTITDWIIMATKDCLLEEWFIIYKDNEIFKSLKETIASEHFYSEKGVIQQCIDNKIRRNSTDCTIRVTNGSSCDIYSEWIGELLHNENKVIIFDQFFMSLDCLDTFDTYLAPLFSGKKVYIYIDTCEWAKLKPEHIARWNNIAEKNNISIEVFSSRTGKKADEEHDRHLFLSANIHVSIGRSIDFLDSKTNKVKGTTISIKRDEQITPYSLQEEYKTNQNVTAYKKETTFPRKKKS